MTASTRTFRRLVAAAVVANIIVALAVLGCNDDGQIRTSLAVTEALAADTAGYDRADRVRIIRFPDDHGAHPGYRTEWWYYTGNLASADDRRFGYQLTIFRTALRPDTSDVPSSRLASADSLWSTRQLYMAHFALSDPTSGAFYSAERFSRGSAGLAGSQAAPYRVWLEDWSISGPDADSVRLTARSDSIAIDLTLFRIKPVVFQGERGLDRKGPEPGNASYYYSMTRLATSGTVMIDEQQIEVEGLSWMDHEWSTSALGEDHVGWDWFALQLDSGREITYYRLREREGGRSEFSGGALVDEAGGVVRLEADDVVLEPLDLWRSPRSGVEYPVDWHFGIPEHGVDLHLEALLEAQELTESVTYWEGAVRIDGSESGYGFVELTGYGESEGGLAGR